MNYFKVIEHEGRPLSWWYDQYKSNRLDMSPAYQRKADLWSDWKKAHLIDSILNDFDIPKIYVADFTESPSTLNPNRRAYSIIDGKQRLGAIFDFFDDRLPLNLSFVLDEEPGLILGGKKYSELPPFVSSRLDNFTPVVMSVVTNDENRITEMFTRLNSGESANSAERRNAIPGPVTKIIRQITANRFFIHKIHFNVKRMQEFNLAAKLALIEFKGGFVDTKARNLDSFAREGAHYFVEGFVKRRSKLTEEQEIQLWDKYNETEDNVLQVLDKLAVEFSDKDPLLVNAGSIPLYYWLMRQNPELCKSALRPFIEEFTYKVKKNLRLSREKPDFADPELMNYYTMGRTTNDQGSLVGRYNILLKHLKSFKGTLSLI